MTGYLDSLGELVSLQEVTAINSAGNLKKWLGKLKNGVTVYIKSCSSVRGHYNYECETECVCSELALLLGMVDVVRYRLDKLNIKNNTGVVEKSYKVCVSADFVKSGAYSSISSLIPNIFLSSGVDKYNKVIAYLNQDLRLQLDSILLFDAVVLNNDRHLRNIGILNKTIMPLFDNGNSLFYDKSLDFITKVLKTNLDYQPCKPFYSTFDNQLKLIGRTYLTAINKVEVYRVVNTYFSGKRAKLLNKLLVMRLERLGLLCR